MRHGIYQKNLKNVRSHLTADIFRYMVTMVFDIASLFYLLLFGKVMEAMFSFKINTECKLPPIGYGTYKSVGGDCTAIFREALRQGYRYIDTASFYGNEVEIGTAIKESGLKRTDLLLASKVWKTEMGYDETLRAAEHSLSRLGTDYLDLYLIHWPRPDLQMSEWEKLDRETWRAMERLLDEGVLRAIGVSNFLPHHIENLAVTGNVAPAVNQIEFHPGYPQLETVAYCHTQNILPQAWSPLGRTRVLAHPLIQTLSENYGKTPAQICLNYALMHGVMPLPKASSPERMRENLDAASFSMEAEDVAVLDEMETVGWSGLHPGKERAFTV